MLSYTAREGYPIIFAILCVAVLFLIFSFPVKGQFKFVFEILSLLSFLFLLFTIFFFRDPDRKTDLDPKALISPADGTVIDIKKMDEPQYLKSSSIRISIFMSVFNVHVNRSPLSGCVEFLNYNQGKFISAFKDKASEENESLFVGIKGDNDIGKIAVKFIAGLIARRIVFYKNLNDNIKQGERINIIRFGSRVDLYCPTGTEIMVKKGDKVTAGNTVMAILKHR
jgi:phosphatidylserine decarboxylase